jgi:dipeptidyl aminopeptidase/acylaminoacyl peptidase
VSSDHATFPATSPYADLAAYCALPRLTGLALSPDGTRLVTTMQQPDADGARYASALWEVSLDGGDPQRLTRSAKGEADPAFLPDGSLLFCSSRPVPDGDEDESRLWVLPPAGEARLLAAAPGGLSAPVVAARAGTVVVTGSRLVGSTDADDDAERRRDRKTRETSAILHTGFPIRYWDHELGDASSRLFVVDADGSLRDLTPDAGFALTNADYSISADGATLAITWRVRRQGGSMPPGIAVLDVASGTRTTIVADSRIRYAAPRISPDGTRVAAVAEDEGDFDTPLAIAIQIFPVEGGAPVDVELGDVHPAELAWSHDGQTLVVSGDLHGRGAVLAVDPTTGSVRSRLADDAVHTSLCPAPDGSVFALRSTIGEAPTPVRLDAGGEHRLTSPAPTPPLPGRLEEVSVRVDGAEVHGWLCRPDADAPAPLMQWIHGGPFMSYNAWSWRWNPWVAVAAGWAVLLPDPALSTGYGRDFLARAWPHRAALVWRDVEALLDSVLTRPDLDADRTVLLGASFGGYMTNWIAGHTDRFRAIVTHAGLWALDQQHTTTDAADWKTGLFGTPADHPDWYTENSPHLFADRISTPMLVIHGNRDYRVPISEALRLWWDLVRRWPGEPETLPHRFLQLPAQNHWVLTPSDAEIWHQTVLAFCAQHADV